jgi:predicted nucleic acid-binding protein
MILVDTSVVIDLLNGTENPKVAWFRAALHMGLAYGFSIFSYLEVLQGAKNEKDYGHLKNYMSAQKYYALPTGLPAYEETAKLYRHLRKKGKTIRSTIDLLIAQTAIHYDLHLLHNDRDFDILADDVPALKVVGKNWIM